MSHSCWQRGNRLLVLIAYPSFFGGIHLSRLSNFPGLPQSVLMQAKKKLRFDRTKVLESTLCLGRYRFTIPYFARGLSFRGRLMRCKRGSLGLRIPPSQRGPRSPGRRGGYGNATGAWIRGRYTGGRLGGLPDPRCASVSRRWLNAWRCMTASLHNCGAVVLSGHEQKGGPCC